MTSKYQTWRQVRLLNKLNNKDNTIYRNKVNNVGNIQDKRKKTISENKIMDIDPTQPDTSPSLTFNSLDQRRKPDRRKSSKL